MPYTEDLPEPETKAEPEDILGEADAAEETDSSETEANTALIPRTLLGDKVKPGDKMQVEVVHLYEDEAEVKLSKSKAEEPDDMENSMRDLEKYGKSSEMA